jgi:hypothetical protein
VWEKYLMSIVSSFLTELNYCWRWNKISNPAKNARVVSNNKPSISWSSQKNYGLANFTWK